MTRAAALVAIAALLASPPAAAREAEATDVTESGLHAGLTRTRGGDKNGQLAAFGISFSHLGFGYEKPFTLRVINGLSLAVGEKGIEGGFENAVAGGVRVPVGLHHGLVVRGGVEFSIFGNRYLWNSLLELPQLHVGYQWLVPGAVLDIAAKSGYVLFGRHNTGDSGTRDLGGAPEIGGIGSIHYGPIDLRSGYSRIYPRHGGTPVQLFQGALCGNPRRLVFCTDVRYEQGDARLPDGTLRDAHVSYLGMTIGIVL